MSQSVLVTKNEMAEFVRRLMAKIGCRLEDADQLAQVYVSITIFDFFRHDFWKFLPIFIKKKKSRFFFQLSKCFEFSILSHLKVLVDADYRGHFSHGLNRLEMYFNDIRTGVTDSSGHVSLTDDTRQ